MISLFGPARSVVRGALAAAFLGLVAGEALASSTLVEGRRVIEVPEVFRLTTETEGLTVQLTPLGDARLWIEHCWRVVSRSGLS